ncbi:Flp pilus assembly protein CpaB [Sphingomicrobium astaxanthinifaciens]|uniref:Flp pilus assembly protein CpaB n=1 Tax=Sphingomicrobium astaxanthinifaciens TaxID=1227949 RepID=UPI001FCCA892|nr:Flp pilus assembly protein CpaB [Sphingomicrobium astaxanthinifaciens]MCJ7422070.1 Flp pilus assembly protein CpaB [Sphingomicrobium astaxanthinifaciens]
MNAKKLMLLVGALVIAVVTAFMARSLFSGEATAEAQAAAVPQGPKVMVANKPLPVGTIIDAEALTFQPWPEELVQNVYYTETDEDADPSALIGTVVRNAISAGQPITRGALVGPNDRGFLAAALGPGMRAVSVPISATTGVSGFVFPGDRVDIVVTHAVESDNGKLDASETIVRNVRVLAINQSVDGKNAEGVQTANANIASATLEVTPKIAEKVSVAQSLGKLSLVLRSIADNGAELERAVAAGEVDLPEDATPDEERRILLQVANRPVDSNTTYTTGGQVSRLVRDGNPSARNRPAQTAAQPAAAPAAGAAPAPSAGPSVRIARGNAVTVVPVGSN